MINNILSNSLIKLITFSYYAIMVFMFWQSALLVSEFLSLYLCLIHEFLVDFNNLSLIFFKYEYK